MTDFAGLTLAQPILRAISDEGYTVPTPIQGKCIPPLIEGRDRHDIVEAELHRRLAEDPEITAIYSAGAGNAGLVRVLARRAEGRPIVVLHELVAHSRQALETGLVDVVIDQRPEDEIQTALECLRAMADRRDLAAPAPIVPAIYLRENLPPAAEASQFGDPVHE